MEYKIVQTDVVTLFYKRLGEWIIYKTYNSRKEAEDQIDVLKFMEDFVLI